MREASGPWGSLKACIAPLAEIWTECLSAYGGPYLFGSQPCLADAMYAPVVTRFVTYGIALDEECLSHCQHIMALPAMQEWVAAAQAEPEEIDELEAEF